MSCNSCPVPPLFFFFVPAQLPLRGSAPLPSGLACLSPACWSTPRVGLEGSGCVLFLRACSVRCFPWGWFSGLILLRLLAGLSGLCTLCQGAPVAVLSAWFGGGVPLLPFLYLRVGVLLAEVSPEFVGCEGSLGCPSWFVILFLCLLILHHFWSWGGFWSQVGGPSCDSWFWTLLMLGYTFLTPEPLPLLPSLAVGWSRHLPFLALCLGFILLASRVGCLLEVIEVFP